MKRLLNISLLLFAVLFVFGMEETAEAARPAHAEQNETSSVIPENRPQLFVIHRQGQSISNLLRNIPVPNARSNYQEITNPGSRAEAPIRRAVSITLLLSRDIIPGLTVREILFPFHEFL